MTTPTEFKKIKDLRQIDDAGIKPDLFMLFESDIESTKVLLSQLAAYIREPLLGSVVPAGVPMPWAGATPPPGHVFINDGYTFDIVKYPLLALAWPNGEIPPHKGLVIECTADGAVTGKPEQGSIALHSHDMSHDHSGEFKGEEMQEHGHNLLSTKSDGYTYYGKDKIYTVRDDGPSNSPDGMVSNGVVNASAGTPSGSVSVSRHGGNTGDSGSSRNTVDRINYNMMVRLA